VTAIKTPAKAYSAEDVQHLAGAEVIRSKPAMYLGEPGPACAFTVVREVVDNVVDEALNGHASACLLYVDTSDKTKAVYTVADNGRGIPIGMSTVTDAVSGTTQKLPALQVVTGLIHGGAKMGQAGTAYEVSRGSHGVGIKGTNFTAKTFEVWSCFNGKWQYIAYRNGKLVVPVKATNAPTLPHSGKPATRGTVVKFSPDPAIIGADRFPLVMFEEWASVAAYFTDGLTVTITGKGIERKDWNFPEGPATFVSTRVGELQAELIDSKMLTVRNALCDVVLGFSNYDGCDFAAFTNGLRNPDKGVHFDGVFGSLMKAITPFITARQKFGLAELKEGVVGLVNVKLSAPKFSSQTKDKLVDERAGKPLRDLLEAEFAAFFAANKAMASRITARCSELASARAKFSMTKKALMDVKKAINGALPFKAMTAPHAKPEQRELYLLEGDSASGICREARNPSFQEVLPLRGKLKNASRTEEAKNLVSSSTVLDILTMLGFDPSKPDYMDHLRVKNKLVILTDPDPDGPLNGDAMLQVLVHADKSWHTVTMRELHESLSWQELSYSVVAWDHVNQKFVLAPVSGTNAVDLKPTDEVCCVEFENGRYWTTPKHRWVAAKTEVAPGRNVNYEGNTPKAGELQFVTSDNLKTGLCVLGARASRKYAPQYAPMHTQTLLIPNAFGAEGEPVRKFKTQKVGDRQDLKRLYCLMVPKYHNFVLSSGVISGNSHISTLILSLIYKLMPEMFAKKMVYQCIAPEFYAMVGKKAFYGMRVADLRANLAEAGASPKTALHHIKGYGELPAKQVEEVAFNPATRRIMRIEIINTDSGVEFLRLMGKEVTARKLLLGI
jgi:DNA gyrase/topoisomerase IV subunit B